MNQPRVHRRDRDLPGRPQARARAFTMVETIMCILIVGVMFVAVMRSVAATQTLRFSISQRNLALLLAQDLMGEVLNQNYEEPVQAVAFGRESGESGGNREYWDDIDDFDGWSSSPPETSDGTAIAGTGAYERDVEINWVNSSNPDASSPSETGVKRIRVRVLTNGRVVTTLTAFRTQLLQDPLGSQELTN